MHLIKVRKLFETISRPSLWRGLRLGVAPSVEHKRALSNLAVDTVLDIGANRGQFSLLAKELFKGVKVYAFEPLSKPADVFRKVFSEDESIKLFQYAIGEKSDSRVMHVAKKDDSSSILEFAQQREVFNSAIEREESISIKPIAEFLGEMNLTGVILAKIDVQGYELQVLKGCATLLPEISYVYVECSFVELYRGQGLASDVISLLWQHGFEVRGVFNQHCDPRFGPVQADFLFRSRTLAL
jgi:FkbM family methyltransferase